MSVLVSKRDISTSEYAMHFANLYKFTEKEIKKLPNRYLPYLGNPILLDMNIIYKLIMTSNDQYFKSDKTKEEQALTIIAKIKQLHKKLLALWNIQQYDINRMIRWCSLLNKEIYYVSLFGELGWEEAIYMYIIDYEVVNKVAFLGVMKDLQKIIYSKTISLPLSLRNSKGNLLMDLADEAFYAVCEANRIFPQTKEQYEKRTKYISVALIKIKQMQVPLFSIFSNMHYNNQSMYEMTNLINREFGLLQGLLKSDKERFGQLK